MAVDRFMERVAAEAAKVKPVRVLLGVLVLPFLVLGAVLAVLWILGTWCYGAAVTGFVEVRDRARPAPPAGEGDT